MAQKVKFSVGQKTTLLILVFAIILGFFTIFFGYQVYSRSMDEHFQIIGDNMLDSAAAFIDGDSIDKYVNTLETDAEYDETLANIRKLLVDDRAKYLFVFRPTEEGQLYIYDSDETDERYPLGYVDRWYEESTDLEPAFLAGEPVAPMVSNEEFGWIMTQYQPIYDSEGNTTAYVGVDLSMDQIVADKQHYLFTLLGVIIIVSTAFCLLYVIVIRKIIVNPINKMAKAADEYLVDQSGEIVQPGQAPTSLSKLHIVSKDELGSLADSLHSMEEKINEYILHLDVATKKAETDVLTGVYNREASNLRINAILHSSAPEEDVHAFMMIDLDSFKQINDTYGHIVGDEVLQKCAHVLKSSFRSADIVARMGGDEFSVFLNSVGNAELVHKKARMLKEALSQIKIREDADEYLTASIGIALYPGDGTTAEELYLQADSALYAVKADSKGGYKMVSDIDTPSKQEQRKE